MKKLVMVVLALGLLAAGAMGQEVAPAESDLEITESATPSPEEPQEDVQVEEQETQPEPETAVEIEVTEAPVEALPWESRTKDRFGDSWARRQESVVIGSSQNIPYDKAVTDVVTLGGSVELDGYADGDVVTVGGSTRIGKDAVVEGDLVTVLGNVTIEDGAEIHGEGVCVLGTIIDPGNAIRGQKVAISGPIAYAVPALAVPTLVTLILLKLLNVVASLLLAYLVVALMPNGIVKVGDQLARNPFVSGLVGGGALVALPLLFIILAITCIGILLVPLAFVIAWVVAQTVVAHRIGYGIRSAVRKNSYRPYIDVTIGMLLLALIPLVPVVGWVVKFLLVMAGLGAVVLTRFGSRDGMGLVPVPVVAPVASEHVDEQVEPAE